MLPAEIVAASAEGFRLRGVLEAAFYPELRRPGYSFWRDVADLIRNTELVELPRWLLGSGARAAAIARKKGWEDPVAAEHLVIDAVANRQRPVEMENERFAALTPLAQDAAVFQHCLAGKRDRARTLMGLLQRRGRDLGGTCASLD